MTRSARRYLFACAAAGLAFASSCAPADAADCTPMLTTAYSRESFPGITADGRSVWAGDWAATHPWSPYPYGTRFTLPDGRRFELADVGDMHGHMPSPWLDLLLDTQAEAIEWGRRELCVSVTLP